MALRPIGEILVGLEIEDLEDGDMPVDAVVLIKTVNTDEDKPGWYQRATRGLNATESLGALAAAHATELAGMVESFRPDDD